MKVAVTHILFVLIELTEDRLFDKQITTEPLCMVPDCRLWASKNATKTELGGLWTLLSGLLGKM